MLGTVIQTRPNRWQILAWISLAALSLGSALVHFNAFQFGAYSDDAFYIILARSLVNSNTYGLINQPGIPGIANFPFGFPLFLAPIVAFFPANLDILKLIPLIATFASAALLFWGWRWLSKSTSFWWGLAVSGLFLLQPVVVGHEHLIMSEPLFLFFCLLAMILVEKAARQPATPIMWIAIGLAFTFVIFTRTIGFTIVGGLVFYLWLRLRRGFWIKLPVILLTMIVVLGLVVIATPVSWGQIIPIKYFGSYSALAKGTASETLDQSGHPASKDIGTPGLPPWIRTQAVYTLASLKAHLVYDIPGMMLPILDNRVTLILGDLLGISFLPPLIGLSTLAFMVFGAVVWFRREGWTAFNLPAIPYLAITLVWISSGNRLFYPLLPQMILSTIFAAHAVLHWFGDRVGRHSQRSNHLSRGLTAGIVIILMVVFFVKSLDVENSILHAGDISRRTSWIVENAEPGAVIMSENPVVDYLYTVRKTVPYPDTLSEAPPLLQSIRENKVRYILIAPFLAWDIKGYQPDFGSRGTKMLVLLEDLSKQNLVRRVHSWPAENIFVYEVEQSLWEDS